MHDGASIGSLDVARASGPFDPSDARDLFRGALHRCLLDSLTNQLRVERGERQSFRNERPSADWWHSRHVAELADLAGYNGSAFAQRLRFLVERDGTKTVADALALTERGTSFWDGSCK